MANTYWVCKPDGTIQCQDNPEATIQEVRKQLASLIGEDQILSQEKRRYPVVTMCGAPTGAENAYEITAHGYFVLTHGIVGPMGFSLCGAKVDIDGGESPDLAAIVASTRITSVTKCPALLRDLPGRVARVYRSGDALTADFDPDRVNIELAGSGRIVDIWFG